MGDSEGRRERGFTSDKWSWQKYTSMQQNKESESNNSVMFYPFMNYIGVFSMKNKTLIFKWKKETEFKLSVGSHTILIEYKYVWNVFVNAPNCCKTETIHSFFKTYSVRC